MLSGMREERNAYKLFIREHEEKLNGFYRNIIKCVQTVVTWQPVQRETETVYKE